MSMPNTKKQVSTIEHKQAVPSPVIAKNEKGLYSTLPWSPWAGIILVIIIYFAQRYVGSIAVYIFSIIPYLVHGSHYANNWLQNSVTAQFLFIVVVEAFGVAAIYTFLRHYKTKFAAIGLHRPHWRDLLYGLLAVPFYYVAYLAIEYMVSRLVPSFNVRQQQQIGFTSVHGAPQLVMTAISLCILPPIAEEIIVRGALYTSLRKGLAVLPAAVITSVFFASAHLSEGGSAGLFWVGALETFVLSLFLVALRERTKNLWASMTLHAVNNSVAFYIIYLVPIYHLHVF
jgi:membrane protease YdiL (CAAX protease family)